MLALSQAKVGSPCSNITATCTRPGELGAAARGGGGGRKQAVKARHRSPSLGQDTAPHLVCHPRDLRQVPIRGGEGGPRGAQRGDRWRLRQKA